MPEKENSYRVVRLGTKTVALIRFGRVTWIDTTTMDDLKYILKKLEVIK